MVSFLTWVVYSNLWMLSAYNWILLPLAISSFCLGVWLVISSRFSWGSILFVFVILLIGQWWIFETIVVLTIWTFKGMAP